MSGYHLYNHSSLLQTALFHTHLGFLIRVGRIDIKKQGFRDLKIFVSVLVVPNCVKLNFNSKFLAKNILFLASVSQKNAGKKDWNIESERRNEIYLFCFSNSIHSCIENWIQFFWSCDMIATFVQKSLHYKLHLQCSLLKSACFWSPETSCSRIWIERLKGGAIFWSKKIVLENKGGTIVFSLDLRILLKATQSHDTQWYKYRMKE